MANLVGAGTALVGTNGVAKAPIDAIGAAAVASFGAVAIDDVPEIGNAEDFLVEGAGDGVVIELLGRIDSHKEVVDRKPRVGELSPSTVEVARPRGGVNERIDQVSGW